MSNGVINGGNTYLGGISEEAVAALIGEYIHVPENHHIGPEGEEANVWFAGQVAGYERTIISYNYINQEFMEEPIVYFNLLMTDGAGYVLSNKQLEIKHITKEEFDILLTEHLAREAMKEEGEAQIEQQIDNVLQFPERRIILPGEQ